MADLKRLQEQIDLHYSRQTKKKSRIHDLIVENGVVASPRELRAFASRRGYKNVTLK